MKIAVSPEDVKCVGIVGTGLIGSGWTAHFLAQGLDVIATDPHPEAEKNLASVIEAAWPSLKKLGLAKEASPGRLRFTSSVEEVCTDADFIQESTPETENIKDTVIANISRAARSEVVIASSTSGILPTRLQAQCINPERMIVGHPFNPSYLIPLVEVVGGQQTSPETVQWTMDFYKRWGKSPLHCRSEIPGHIANRLQEALFSEALQLVENGIATTAEIDAALSTGPGLRWGLLGVFLTAHIASKNAGLRDVLEGKFGSYVSTEESPVHDKIIIERILEEASSQISGHSTTEIEQMRDDFLVGLIKFRAEIEKKYGFEKGRFFESQSKY